MVDRLMYWATAVFAGVALLFFVVDYAYIKGNQSLQRELNEKQLVINTAIKVQPLNQQLSQALYQASLENKGDRKQIQDLLLAQGFVLPAEKEATGKESKDSSSKK